MPLVPFTYAPISQRVADRAYDESIYCQIATWVDLIVHVRNSELFLELVFDVTYHSLLNGEPGAKIPEGKGMSSWPQTLYANNDCAVYFNPAWPATAAQPQDPRNGQILYYRIIGATGYAWTSLSAEGVPTELQGGLEAALEPVLKQGDAFALQMDTPLGLAQMIRYHLNAANHAPFNKFS